MSPILDLLAAGQASSTAIVAPGRPPLTYREVREQVAKLGGQLAAFGISPADRVAIILPNGPGMALAFMACSAHAAAAPLNPAYREAEVRFYLEDLRAMALIVAPGAPAHDLPPGVRLLTLEGEPGDLTLAREGRPLPVVAATAAAPEDVALLLHTSGTTARPKLVPLTGANLAASARNIAATLQLTPTDRCLNIMPLFHIHGLIAALLASLSAGASVVCTPGYDAFRFFEWLSEFHPTWYTAVPTMHQGILARGARQREGIARDPLRFIRSSSAALPPSVLASLEALFGAPAVEAYGMTEASHQMCSNPLPPRAHKPGSVGPGAGAEVRILGGEGGFLAVGERGEVVIRGPGVTAGYERNPEANVTAFHDGWFRTGDEGYLDEDGYLFLTGRLKEMINRGGEKVSPVEVEEVLLQHPAVAQAAVFAIPHERLGEEVGAAVVLCEGTAPTERELRDHCGATLAAFKVPRRVVLLDEIPKGPTGKLQRIGLAQRLGLG
jgi:acyl-CoA synthetase (AMP-forming)/AMP-acid ligase II